VVAAPLRRLAIALVLVLFAVPGAGETQWSRFPAMGTSVEMAVRHEDAGTRREALDAARLVFERFGREWYPWNEDSELHRLNTALANGEAVQISPALVELLQRSRTLSCRSGGRFDPAIGGLVESWGFHRPPPYTDPPPAADRIDRWLAAGADIGDLQISGHTVTSTNPAVQIDLGGIAKGALIDRALAAIRAHGIGHAMVNAGGDLAVIGTAQGRPWHAGIRDPRPGPGQAVLATRDLPPGEALFTSGDDQRFRTAADGERLGHVLDPRTGRPVQEAVQVAVIADSGTIADAAATALMVADTDAWPRVAGALGVDAVLRMESARGGQVTHGLATRLQRGEPGMKLLRVPLPPVEDTGCD